MWVTWSGCTQDGNRETRIPAEPVTHEPVTQDWKRRETGTEVAFKADGVPDASRSSTLIINPHQKSLEYMRFAWRNRLRDAK